MKLSLAAILLVGIDAVASAQECSTPLSVLFIGNSYTGGTGVGKVCVDKEEPPGCEDYAIPGNVTAAFDAGNYDGTFQTCCDYAPVTNLFDTAKDYDAYSNPHKGDVPGKIKRIADEICGASPSGFGYAQNSQSQFFSTTHARQTASDQRGTLALLDNYPHDVVVVQPQSEEYLIDEPVVGDNSYDKRVAALNALLQPAPNRNFVQQTWPRRKQSDIGNQHKCQHLDVIDNTISALQGDVMGSFDVLPTGLAFLEFAELACPDIFAADPCTLDEAVECPIFFGESNKVSLYHEPPNEAGTHQSEEVGAWLSAAVIYGVVQSSQICYVSESVIASVMPTVADLANITSGVSIEYLVSEAARKALEVTYGVGLPECAAGTRAPTASPVPSIQPSASVSPTLPGICSDGSGRCTDASQCECGASGSRMLKGKDEVHNVLLRALKGQPVKTGKPTRSPTESPIETPIACICSTSAITNPPTASPTTKPTANPMPTSGVCLDKGTNCPCGEVVGTCSECCAGSCEKKGNNYKCA